MGIKDDAIKLLNYIYEEFTENKAEDIDKEQVYDNHEMEKERIHHAINYLDDENLIKVNKKLANGNKIADFYITRITARGVKSIEEEKQFKNTFGAEVGIPGFVKLKWSKTEE